MTLSWGELFAECNTQAALCILVAKMSEPNTDMGVNEVDDVETRSKLKRHPKTAC